MNKILSPLFLVGAILVSMLISSNLMAQSTTATQSFTHATYDDSGNDLILNFPQALTVTQGQTPTSITLTNFSFLNEDDEIYCDEYYLSYSLLVDGNSVLDSVCSQSFIGQTFPSTSVVTIQLHDMDDYSDYHTFVVEFTVEFPTPSCPAIINLLATTVFDDNASFSWTAGETETAWIVEWGAAGFTPGAGIGTQTVTTPSIALATLTPNTAYEIIVKADCSTEQSFPISKPFMTSCAPISSIDFCADFEDTATALNCWRVLDLNNDYNEMYDEYKFVLADYDPANGDNHVFFASNWNQGNNDYLILPLIDLAPNSLMTFNYSAGDDLKVLLSTTGNEPHMFTTELASLTSDGWDYADTFINLFQYSGEVYIAFAVVGDAFNSIYIDDVCFSTCTQQPGVDGSVTLCNTADSIELNSLITTAFPDGQWSNTLWQGAINDSTSMVDLTLMAAGTYEFIYRSEDRCLTDTVLATITLVDPISAGDNSTLTYCKNQYFNLTAGLSGNYVGGGTWINPSGVVVTSTQLTTPNLPGQIVYKYIVNNNICPADTAEILVNVLGCDFLSIDNQDMQELTVSPNPTNGKINITGMNASQVYSIQVMDVNGRTVSTQTASSTASTNLDLDTFTNGIYFIQLTTEQTQQTIRVVKQ